MKDICSEVLEREDRDTGFIYKSFRFIHSFRNFLQIQIHKERPRQF